MGSEGAERNSPPGLELRDRAGRNSSLGLGIGGRAGEIVLQLLQFY